MKKLQKKILKYLGDREFTTYQISKGVNLSWQTAYRYLLILGMDGKVSFRDEEYLKGKKTYWRKN